MSDSEHDGSEPVFDDSSILEGSTDPARSAAGRREAERIQKERQEAAQRLAAVRAQIAEFDQGGRQGHRWGWGSRGAKPASPPSEGATQGAAHMSQDDRRDQRDADRDVLAPFAGTRRKDEVQDEPAPPATAAVSARASGRTSGRPAGRPSSATGRSTGFSMNVDFTPRTATRSALTLLLLLSIAATVLVGLTLREDQNTLNVGLTATLGVVTLFLYAIRVSSPVSYLRVRGGVLEIKRAGRRDVFDLSSRFAPIDVIGQPGKAGWKVVLLRTDGMPQTIDSSLVDPKHFMEVLCFYRPELDPDFSRD